ncbi:MAG: 3-hydroxylacyl-ACP dehydratase [Nitrospiraceae bacterium]|nr:3-hydroxylacyl-ACP dehydratase [Nitrospiraceae bacterium]
MSLLSVVENWDTRSITCSANSHRDPQNPLRRSGQLDSLCGLEYAAQAMAIHFGLTSIPEIERGPIGFLGGIRDLNVTTDRLDLYEDNLTIVATLLFPQEVSFLYAFSVNVENSLILKGRASIFIKGGHHS